MAEFIYHKAGATEAQQKKGLAFLLAQDSVGLATDGVLTGLGVTQTGTASTAVLVAAGAGQAQDTVGNGAAYMINDTQKTLDILTANPMGGVPRNDIVVFDSATGSIRAIIGTPNASPTDPTVPTTAVQLARIRNLASATTIPTAQIDDRRVKTALFGASDENFVIRGVPFAGASVTKAGKRVHWAAFSGTTNSGGVANFSHGAGFTPSIIHPVQYVVSGATVAFQVHYVSGSADGSTFQVQVFNGDGTARSSAITVGFTCYFGE
jgi:hypothetical protein